MMQAVARGSASSSKASSSAASLHPYCRKVFVDMPNALSRSNFQWRGKSVAASVPSDSSVPSKVQRRIPKHERRAMVVSFVDKYRATNSGKFPSISLTKQQIGGSHYIIREILQELAYKSKFPPVKEAEGFPLKKEEEDMCTSSDARKERPLTKTEDSSVSVLVESCTLHGHSNFVASFSKEIVEDIKVDKSPGGATEAYESHRISNVGKACDESLSVNVDKTGLPNVKSSTAGAVMPGLSMANDSVKQLLEGVENSNNGLSHVDSGHVPHGHKLTYSAVSSSRDSETDMIVSSGSQSARAKSEITQDKPKSFSGEPDGSRGDREGLNVAEQECNQEPSKAEDMYRDISRDLGREEASPKKSTVWGNLKSLAHGIINFWKNK